MTPEEKDDLVVGYSLVRIRPTSVIGRVVKIDGDNITVRYNSHPSKEAVFKPIELVYYGTPGVDAPYEDDCEPSLPEKKLILVFPDYCSPGLWGEDGKALDPSEVGVSPGLQVALKYWHEMWEFNIVDLDDDRYTRRLSDRYVSRWVEDGKKLAALMSAENPNYRFEYKD